MLFAANARVCCTIHEGHNALTSHFLQMITAINIDDRSADKCRFVTC